jgi:hypothetical protein
MKLILIAALAAFTLNAQTSVRWFATTGDVSLSAAATAATIQQPATNGTQAFLDQIVVYCSAACNVTLSANGTAATATAGTITPLLPTPLNNPIPQTFWTASNVGTGTAQGGIIHIPAGGTVTLCLSPSCGNPAQVILGNGAGTASNYTASIASVTATVNITFYGRSQF